MKISVLTGKRGGFGAMVPLIEKLVQHNFKIEVIMTDQHLNTKFGYTSSEVEARLEGICDLVNLPLNQQSDSKVSRATALSLLSSLLTSYLSENPTDFLMVYGDRGETLTSAVVATHLQIPIIHLQGGDKSGSVDDWMRHAVTKLSHIHYASTEDSASRILRLGEEPWRVFVIGDSHLDPIIEGAIATNIEFLDKYGIELDKPTLVVLQHSETTEAHLSRYQMQETMNAVSKFPDFQKVVIYPCSDIGYEGVIRSIEFYRGVKNFHIFENIEAPYFRRLIQESLAIIGNSSAGLIEAPSLGTPSVNIGRRQVGRLRGSSVTDCGHEATEIVAAIKNAIDIPKVTKFDSPYAIDLTQTSASKMVKHFSEIANRKDLFGKTFYE